MENLVTIAKEGEKNLRIHVDALAQHVKLGWKKVEDVVEEVVQKVEAAVGKKSKPAEKSE